MSSAMEPLRVDLVRVGFRGHPRLRLPARSGTTSTASRQADTVVYWTPPNGFMARFHPKTLAGTETPWDA